MSAASFMSSLLIYPTPGGGGVWPNFRVGGCASTPPPPQGGVGLCGGPWVYRASATSVSRSVSALLVAERTTQRDGFPIVRFVRHTAVQPMVVPFPAVPPNDPRCRGEAHFPHPFVSEVMIPHCSSQNFHGAVQFASMGCLHLVEPCSRSICSRLHRQHHSF